MARPAPSQFRFMEPGPILAAKMRVLMELCTDYIEPMPDGSRRMEDREFINKVLGVIDTQDTAKAVEAFEQP